MAMAKCGAYAELLDMAVWIAVRSYTHLPQTSRAYYKPPPTTTTATTNNGGASARRRSSADFKGDASSARNQQQAAAVRVAFDATEIMFSGVVLGIRHCPLVTDIHQDEKKRKIVLRPNKVATRVDRLL